MEKIDFLVIGGGSAGYAAARTAVEYGLRTMVVESGEDVGGLCILRGCMPSKAILESANRFATLRRAKEFGLHAENPTVFPKEIQKRKRWLIRDFASYRQGQLEDGRFIFHRGHAAFLNENSVQITLFDGQTFDVTFRAAIIATGSTIAKPKLEGLEEVGYLISDDALNTESLPHSIIVLGGGPVALEMAYYYHTLGVETTLIQRSPQVLKEADADVAESLVTALRKQGMHIFTDTHFLRAERTVNQKRVVFRHEKKEHSAEAEEILQALGRTPNTENLMLANAGIVLHGKQIKTNERMQTNQPHIYAAGDVASPFEVVHIAIQQGEIAARNAARQLGMLRDDFEKIDYRLTLFATFTEPQVATVGLSEKEAIATGKPIITASYPFSDHGKSMILGETDGFVKMIADESTGEILGASVIGPHASDLIHEIVVAMHFHCTVQEFATIPHYHPTLSEIWTYPAEEIVEKIKSIAK